MLDHDTVRSQLVLPNLPLDGGPGLQRIKLTLEMCIRIGTLGRQPLKLRELDAWFARVGQPELEGRRFAYVVAPAFEVIDRKYVRGGLRDTEG